jgi:hypothetical protein
VQVCVQKTHLEELLLDAAAILAQIRCIIQLLAFWCL